MGYYLEQNLRAQGELEIMSKMVRENREIEMAIELLLLRGRLQDIYKKNWKIIAELFPMIKPESLALFMPMVANWQGSIGD
jgi:hypothetical protein